MHISIVPISVNFTSVVLQKRSYALRELIRPACIVVFAFTLLLNTTFANATDSSDKTAQTILHVLDYLSVDYGGAVLLEKVVNESEYQEQLEFSKQSALLLAKLPDHPNRENLINQAKKIEQLVLVKASADQVGASAQLLRQEIIAAYHVSVTPKKSPDLVQASALFQQICVKCHGVQGFGDGPESNRLDPKPANFHDVARMGQRSVYGLYNTITLGVEGTAMKAMTQLTEDQKWSLAFYVSNLRNTPEYIEQGHKFWEKRTYRGPAPNLAALTTLTSNEIVLHYGEQTRAVFAYLRANPQALSLKRQSTLLFATEQLDQASAFYQSGDLVQAQRIAIAAYLEGFEPMEISIDNLDKQLRRDIEHEMMGIRQIINNNGSTYEVASKIAHTKNLLFKADELLRSGKLSILGAFASALFMLLREGIEGMLVLAAIIAFVVRSGQREALVYIHAGWGAALFLGALTWMAATWLVNISGAGREITEGVTALIASVMLIYVGYWLHDKVHAQSWQKFLKNQVDTALEKKTLWALALISFFAVYREIFETVLFYQALWAQTSDITRPALWGGMMSAILLLISTGWALFRFGIRLPLGRFFTGTSLLLAALAVIFAGQGVAALQEASIIESNRVNFISLPMLGVHPTVQTLLVQVSVIGILVLCYRASLRRKSV